MKVAVLMLVVCLVAVISAKPASYTTKYDNIDLDNILNSERLLKNYFNCMMETGNCTPDGKELRSHLADALETDCSKCNEKQRENAKKIIKFLVRNKQEDMWKPLMGKYDPDKKYRLKHEEEARKEGIDITS